MNLNSLVMLRRMAHNNAWANLRLHHAVSQLSDAEYHAPRVGFFPTLHRTFAHILFVDRFYLGSLEELKIPTADLWKELELWEKEKGFADIAAAQHEADQRLIRFTYGLHTEASLAAPVQIDRTSHVQVERCGDVLLHLFQHQIHHRGQAHCMLSGTAVKPPQLDEFFMAEDLPLREAELRELGLPLV